MDEVQKNNIGTVFRVTVRDQDGVIVDCSTASVKQIIFRKPDGSYLTKSATFTTDGVDGKVQYSSISGDLDTLGTWELQVYVKIGINEWSGIVKYFKVLRNSNS